MLQAATELTFVRGSCCSFQLLPDIVTNAIVQREGRAITP